MVKGVNFVNLRDAGDPVEAARAYNDAGADELVYLDITASHEQRNIMVDVVYRTAAVAFMPVTIGGGLRTVDDINEMLRAGADKVSLNTSAVENPALVTEGAQRFGSQCIVVAIDAKRRWREPGEATSMWWEVFTHGGRTPTGMDALQWATRVEDLGAGELLLTSMDCDGTQNGYDLELTAAIADTVNIPVIASGGAGSLEHLFRALTVGKADAALAASIFHFGDYTIKEAKDYLGQRNVPVRPVVT